MAYNIIKTNDIPFLEQISAANEVLFIDSTHDERINRLVRVNLEFIKARVKSSSGGRLDFIYMPTLLKDSADKLRYNYPDVPDLADRPLTEYLVARYFANPKAASYIPPCLIKFRHRGAGMFFYSCYLFSFDSDNDADPVLEELCKRINADSQADEGAMAAKCRFDVEPPVCNACIKPAAAYDNVMLEPAEVSIEEGSADDRFDTEVNRLMEEVRQKIDRLQLMGVSRWAIEHLVQPERKLSRLVITKRMEVRLPDYDMEIRMEPLVKTVFLLFLRHADGIKFKDLADHKDELYRIYKQVKQAMPWTAMPSESRIKGSIDSLANPLSNSINEKCARIREAFITQFKDELARNYYVTGLRGEAKRITLPRDLVVFDE